MSAVALLVPSLALAVALALAATMVGAILTHLVIVGGSSAAPATLLATTSFIAVGALGSSLNERGSERSLAT